MKTTITILMWLIAGAVMAAETVEPVSITIKRITNVNARTATLGNIAEIRGGDTASRQRFAKLDIADVPLNGTVVRVPRSQIEFRLQLANMKANTFELDGADEVILAFRPNSVSGEQVAAKAREALLKLLPETDREHLTQIQPVGLPFVIHAEPSETTITVLPHTNGPLKGHVQMDATVNVRGERKCMVPVFFDVKAPAAEPKDAGAVLVRVRQPVQMIVRLGAINVVAKGEALQDGKMGQSIRAKNLDSKKEVTGRVVGPNIVKVESGGGS